MRKARRRCQATIARAEERERINAQLREQMQSRDRDRQLAAIHANSVEQQVFRHGYMAGSVEHSRNCNKLISVYPARAFLNPDKAEVNKSSGFSPCSRGAWWNGWRH
jgi:hypothetical protein